MKAKLLKRLRTEAIDNLGFDGGWSGRWTTLIEGVYYRSESVSGLRYCLNDPGYFIPNAILHRVRMMKYGEAKEENIYKMKDKYKHVSTKRENKDVE